MLNIFAICNIAIVSASAASHIGRIGVGVPKIRRLEDQMSKMTDRNMKTCHRRMILAN